MKVGVILPTFRTTAEDAFQVAQRCDALGIDGVFAYDHLWPMGTPTRPSLAPFPVLAAVAARTSTLWVGPLVARVGMFGRAHLVRQFRSLALVAPERVIAAIGTGDAKSRDELEGYGLVMASAAERRGEIEAVARELREEMPVWVGAGATATNALARELDVTLNVWDADATRLAQLTTSGSVTWAGPAHEDLTGWLDEVRDAGADWAVFSPGVDLDTLGHWRREG